MINYRKFNNLAGSLNLLALALVVKVQTEIEKANEYQESLITQVVRGQLKVCDPDVTKPENEFDI